MPAQKTGSLGRDLLLGLVVCLAFFVLVEAALRVAGYPPHDPSDDPFVGFSSVRPLFTVKDGIASTDPARLSYFNESSFAVKKPVGTFRAFAFGESTTYGQPFDGRIAFPRWLQDLLQASDPGKKFEVINAGGISYASYRIVPLIREALRYEPDVAIICLGHNEFLERRTYAGLFRQGHLVVTARSLLEELNLYRALTKLLVPLVPHRDVATRPVALQSPAFKGDQGSADRTILDSEVNAILDRSAGLDLYHRDEDFTRGVVGHFSHNLRTMIALCRTAGVPVILVQPGCNLKDFSPFKSEHDSRFSVQRKTELDREIHRAADMVRHGDFQGALPELDAAIEKDPLFAETYFWKAKALLALGRHPEARANFVKAKDLDVCPLRSISLIEEQIDRIAAEEKVPFIPFRQFVEEVESRSGDRSGIPGNDTFLDHVHPTIAMHQELAQLIMEKMADLGMASDAQRLTRQDRDALYDKAMKTLDPGFFATRDLNLAKLLRWAGKKDEAKESLRRAAELMPDNPEVQKMLGDYLMDDRNHQAAIEEYRRAVRLSGNERRMRSDLAVVCYKAGLKDEAAGIYEQLLQEEKSTAELHANLAMIYLEQGRNDEALRTLEAGLAKHPHSAALPGPYGLALAMANRVSEAIPWTLKAVEGESGDPKHLYNLAGMYALSGKSEDAIHSLNRAVDKGYANPEKLARDPVFESVRGMKEFDRVLQRIR